MKLSDTTIGKFQKIVCEEYGMDLSESEARHEAESLMDFAYLLLRQTKKIP